MAGLPKTLKRRDSAYCAPNDPVTLFTFPVELDELPAPLESLDTRVYAHRGLTYVRSASCLER